MEFRHLRYFVAVAEERHVTRAAQRLGISQPPLSQQIRALELELGVELFVRSARGVELTAAGQALLQEAYAILDQMDRAASRTVRAARGEAGRLSLGFTTSAILHPLVPEIIGAFRQDYQGVELDLHENAAMDLTEALLRHDVQAALLRSPVARPPELAFRELLQEDLLVVLPVGHRLLARGCADGVELRDLEHERFIAVRRPGAPGIYQNLIVACRKAGFELPVAAEVPHMLTNIGLVSAGVGISVVPASMGKVDLPQVQYRRLKVTPPITAPLTFVYQAEDDSALLRNLIAITERLSGEFGSIASPRGGRPRRRNGEALGQALR